MSRDQLSGSNPNEDAARPDLVGLEADQIEAIRLSEVLSADQFSPASNVDPAADPELSALTQTVAIVQNALEAPSAHPRFRSFHERSRARVLAATPRPQPVAAIAEHPQSLLQRWNGLFTSIGAAAAASAATFIVTVLAFGGSSSPAASVQVVEPQPQPASVSAIDTGTDRDRINLTALSVDEQLDRYLGLLRELAVLTSDGQPADQGLLQDLAETGATVARTIETQPDSVTPTAAWVAYQTAFEGQKALDNATVVSDQDQQVLDTAQVAADGAFVTAARFLGNSAPTADEAADALAAAVGPPASED